MTNPDLHKQSTNQSGNHSSGNIIGDHTQIHIYPGSQSQPDELFDAEEVEARYRRQVFKHYNKLALTGLPERDPGLHELTLEHIFVKLNVTIQQSLSFGPSLDQLSLEEEWRRPSRPSRTDDRRMRAELRRLEREASQPQIISLSVAEALYQHKRLVILGGPGSGKTTLTRWLAVVFADQRQGQPETLGANFTTPRLPILIELRRFAERYGKLGEQPVVPDLVTEISSFISNHAYYPETPLGFICQALADGRCLLLFDGLDEIADLGARQLLIQSIQAFLNHPRHAYGANLCLVTSRPYGYQSVSLGAGFQESEVKPFAPEDVKLFVIHWYDTAYGDQAEAQALLVEIEQNAGVAALTTNPLLCTIVAVVYRNNRILPNRRVELYLKCCEALLDTWERNKAIKDSGLIGSYDWQTKLELLAPVAYWLHSERERLSAPEDEYVHQLAAVLQEKGLANGMRAAQEARRFIVVIRDRSGLLQGRGDGTLEFMHRTFQEYLAARHIAAQPDPDYIDLVMEHLHEAWWQEVHLLVIGYLGSSSSTAAKTTKLLHTILHVYQPPLFLLRSFSLRLFIPVRLRRLLNDYEDHFLQWPLRVIAWFYSTPFITQIVCAQFLPNWHLGQRMAWLLQRECELVVRGYLDCMPIGVQAQFGHLLVHTVLKSLVQRVYDPARSGTNILPVRQTLSDAEAAPYVAALIVAFNDTEMEVHRRAAAALGQLGQITPAVIDGLLHALAAPEMSVRYSAADALGRLSQVTPAVVEQLLNTLADAEADVRSSAAKALGRLGQAKFAVVEGLLTALSAPEWYVRSSAIEALKQAGHATPAVIDGLLTALADTEWWVVRHSAGVALQQLSQTTPAVVEGLLPILTHVDPNIRSSTAAALGQIGQPAPIVIDGLLIALADPEKDVRSSAATALGQIGKATPVVVESLLIALTDPEVFVRSSATKALGRLGQATPAVVNGLLHTLADEKQGVRRRAVEALGRLGKIMPVIAEDLLHTLADKRRDVRHGTVEALGQIGQATPSVVEGLLTALVDAEGEVRSSAARALGQLGQATPAVVEGLLTALADKKQNVRSSAVAALGQLGQASPAIVAGLLTALADEKRVRRSAIEALGRLDHTAPSVVEGLVSALTDPDNGIRRSAVDALGRLGQAIPPVVDGLLTALADEQWAMRRSAIAALGKLQIKDEREYSQLLIRLNRRLHSIDDDKRKHVLDAIRTLVNGRPLPGYHWNPLRQRMEQRRRMYAIAHWTILLVGIIMVAFGLSYLDANTRLIQVITMLIGLIGIAAGLAQIVGKSLRNPWEKEDHQL